MEQVCVYLHTLTKAYVVFISILITYIWYFTLHSFS